MFTKPKETYQEIAYENELSSAQAAEDAVRCAFEKMRKYIQSKMQ